MTITTHTFTSAGDLPPLPGVSFFHSPALMEIYAQTPGHSPYMVVATTEGEEENRVVGCMLAVVRSRASWLPPYVYWQCRIYGEGCYFGDAADREDIFGQMLRALTRRVGRRVLFIEVSHLSQKMFGYGHLRQAGFFPVRWMSIHNSLHSKPAEERLSPKTMGHIEAARRKGVTFEKVDSDQALDTFVGLLRRHNQLKLKRFIPRKPFFRGMMRQDCCHMTIARYRGKAIGCQATIYTGDNAYLWFMAFKRKSYAMLHPAEDTVFDAIKRAQNDGRQHMVFLDVGLPFRKNAFREFILRFGGKHVSTFRWFLVRPGWVGRLLSRLFS